ncbi:conserved hypothetical protein [Flavobacterium psychrophilum]|uniref:zinc-dependent peptidase n=1 Tax=Flavobacterium psychrophilum TaxID=96345 RepID=UPI000B7C1376|nr:zinc-dependent peptidase [Flavobacterium psychrophilum]GEJ33054.1 hypothetical protein FPN184_contig00025-0067 [Flavobacterium psychrophilum]GEJ49479.1 hypothetical protein FPKKA176_contig00029-0067 [Flavobacterium psychrophilum]SNB14144.1 conserved hypothetical protein [Flavobacterium psychrophilum]
MFVIYLSLVIIIGIVYLFKIIVQPIYILICKKPLTLRFCLFSKKINPHYKDILTHHFPFYKKLKPKDQNHFDQRVLNFIEDIQFISRDDIEITFEMKLLIASTSIMLTFGMQEYLHTVVRTIIVYPSSFYSTTNQNMHIGEFNPKLKVVVFSWEDFYKGIKLNDDNLNLGIHEFSHVLLFESLKKNKYDAVANPVFLDCYNAIIIDLKKPEFIEKLVASHYFRDYAFVNSVEFIAVILEQFFETPEKFKELFPELFYKVKMMINYNDNSLSS